MDTQEVRDLYEAYLQVHQPQELTEEVEIAAQYFYEMGLNEEGVEILIEELGVEEFSEFVYDLAEEYYLTEARSGGVRVEPVTAKGTKFKGGKPTGKSLERLRSKKAARREAEASASEAKPSGLKSSLQRQSAIANAKKQQPKKKGILDRVAGAVLSGMERHNKAMGELKKMKSATAETAGKVKKAAGEFKKGFVGEETDLFDAILEHLVAEGYADTNENALVIMANMSEEWRQSIFESIDLHEKLRKGTKGKVSFTTGKDSNYNQAMTETNPRTGRQRGTSPMYKTMGAHSKARAAQHDAEQSGDREGAQRHAQRRGRLATVVYNKTNRIIDRADND